MICLNLFENLKHMDVFYGNTFNLYNIIFIFIASIIAGLGLMYNSTATILGSMLVSSIVNPLLAFIVLFMTNHFKMSFFKLLNFILLVVLSGIISVLMGYYNHVFKIFKTPTDEMKARITYTHVFVDILLALLSGFGMALAILNKDIVSRVGFTLILSITPPLVNFGLFYGEALYEYLHKTDKKGNLKGTDKKNTKIDELLHDGNQSLILSALNIMAMFSTLFITLTIMCRGQLSF
jgi:hypothetical protein